MNDGSIKFWRINETTPFFTLKAHTSAILCLKEINSVLASGSLDTTIKIWNLKNVQVPLFILKSHTAQVNTLALLSNGYLASGSSDLSIIIWNVTKGTIVSTIKNAHTSAILKIISLTNGNFASSDGNPKDSKIKIWRISDNLLLNSWHPSNAPSGINALENVFDYLIMTSVTTSTISIW